MNKEEENSLCALINKIVQHSSTFGIVRINGSNKVKICRTIFCKFLFEKINLKEEGKISSSKNDIYFDFKERTAKIVHIGTDLLVKDLDFDACVPHLKEFIDQKILNELFKHLVKTKYHSNIEKRIKLIKEQIIQSLIDEEKELFFNA